MMILVSLLSKNLYLIIGSQAPLLIIKSYLIINLVTKLSLIFGS